MCSSDLALAGLSVVWTWHLVDHLSTLARFPEGDVDGGLVSHLATTIVLALIGLWLGAITTACVIWRRDRARQRAAADVHEDGRLSAEFFEAASEGIVLTDPAARVVRVNRAFTAITGYTLDELAGQNLRLMKSGRHDRAFYEGF